jgi:hypothetical protein
MATKKKYDWVFEEFKIDPLPGKILYARYSYEDCYGYVLYQDPDGELWEVEGSHCSCNGLEGQWSPTKVTVEYLLERGKVRDNTYDFMEEDAKAITRVAKALIRKAKRDAKKLDSLPN